MSFQYNIQFNSQTCNHSSLLFQYNFYTVNVYYVQSFLQFTSLSVYTTLFYHHDYNPPRNVCEGEEEGINLSLPVCVCVCTYNSVYI